MLIGGIIFTCITMEVTGLNYVLPVSECDLRLSTQDMGVLSGVGFIGKREVKCLICYNFEMCET